MPGFSVNLCDLFAISALILRATSIFHVHTARTYRVSPCAYGPYKYTRKGYLKESEAGPPAHVINIPIAKPARAQNGIYVAHDNYGRRGGGAKVEDFY